MANKHYAEATEVSIDRSKAEIERTLQRYGADGFAYAIERTKAMVGFRCHERMIRYVLKMPDQQDKQFQETPSRRWQRSPIDAHKAWEQACRSRWRALHLVIKAKLEAIEIGITTFEEEFLAWTVLPDNTTVGEQTLPLVAGAYTTGKMPPMLPVGGMNDNESGHSPGVEHPT